MHRFSILLSLFAACATDGAEGPQGEPGPQGPSGAMGTMGTMGTSGESVTVTAEPAGSNCTNGGFKLTSSTGTSYVCNGTNGTNGTNGANGSDATAPVGAVVAFAGATPPAGWLLCDGTQVSRTTYAALFTAIGTAWGNGDASTTFNLPDMRGRFLRGTDHGLGSDPNAATRIASAGGGNTGDAVGTFQSFMMQAHTHDYTGAFRLDNGIVGGHVQGGSSTSFTIWGYSATTAGAGGSETRPINVSVNYIIKY